MATPILSVPVLSPGFAIIADGDNLAVVYQYGDGTHAHLSSYGSGPDGYFETVHGLDEKAAALFARDATDGAIVVVRP